MKKVLTEVSPYKAQVYCDSNDHDDVELIFTGNVLTCSPPKYVHRCPACGDSYHLDKNYPSMEYK